MEQDLQWIKANYSEGMMHLCREKFPELLEVEGRLPKLLKKHFYGYKYLAQDIQDQNQVDNFCRFIFSVSNLDKGNIKREANKNKTAKQICDEAGYILYPECKTEAEIQAFRHYYHRTEGNTPVYQGKKPQVHQGEELCTFTGGRLELARVWFMVKKNVIDIKRENFKNPEREDEYGTSVLSVQFSNGAFSKVSIKNRYNLSVPNPDNTFNNNLDNIAPGLTAAFERDYGVKDAMRYTREANFQLRNYVIADDGKLYPYNHEIDYVYYCPDNIIIEDRQPKQLDRDKVKLIGYYMFDAQAKKVKHYKYNIDGFILYLKDIKKIDMTKEKVTVTKKNGELIVFHTNSRNQIVGLEADSLVKTVPFSFQYMSHLKRASFANLEECGDYFMRDAECLEEFYAPHIKVVKSHFMRGALKLKRLELSELESCGDCFANFNKNGFEVLDLSKVKNCGNNFMYGTKVKRLDMSSLENCGNNFLDWHSDIDVINVPNLVSCGDFFAYAAVDLKEYDFSSLTKRGEYFLTTYLYVKGLTAAQVMGKRKLPGNSITSDVDVTHKLTTFQGPKPKRTQDTEMNQ